MDTSQENAGKVLAAAYGVEPDLAEIIEAIAARLGISSSGASPDPGLQAIGQVAGWVLNPDVWKRIRQGKAVPGKIREAMVEIVAVLYPEVVAEEFVTMVLADIKSTLQGAP